MLHVFETKLYLLLSISLSKALMYVVINYQKGGERDHIKALCLIISIGGEDTQGECV